MQSKCTVHSVYNIYYYFTKLIDIASLFKLKESLYFLCCVSVQVCSAPCHQLWCHLWAEHPLLPHCLHSEPWLWSRQWPHETSREVRLWGQVQVPCYGPRPREGTRDFFSMSQPWNFQAMKLWVTWVEESPSSYTETQTCLLYLW